MKHLYWVVLITVGIFFYGCNDDDAGSILSVSQTDIQLEASGSTQQIQIETNVMFWQVAGNPNWVTVARDSCFLRIGADNNPTREPRKAKIAIVAGDKHVSLNIYQEKSIRAVGEYYPDAINPIGVIFSLSDGGVHGKVLSFKEWNERWGPNTEAHTDARDLYNGKMNTSRIIQAHKDQADFETAYPVFWWLHHEMNHDDLNGIWYYPSYYELLELYTALTGNKFSVPPLTNTTPSYAHNAVVKEKFNEILTEKGGTPISYGNSAFYWSSTEYDLRQGYIIGFINNLAFSNFYGKTDRLYARPICAF